jgi:hypothetical protein
MNNAPNTHVPFPSAEERSALVLEFQKVTARLVRAGLISQASATRLVRGIHHAGSVADETRHALPKLILELLLAVDDGILQEGLHYRRIDDGRIALHLESIAIRLYRAQRTTLTAKEMRRLVRFGWAHFREVVVERSQRVCFGEEDDRRRAAILNVAKAQEFVGMKSAVPSR